MDILIINYESFLTILFYEIKLVEFSQHLKACIKIPVHLFNFKKKSIYS